MKHLLLFIAVIAVSCTTTKQNIDLSKYLIKDSSTKILPQNATFYETIQKVKKSLDRDYPNNQIEFVFDHKLRAQIQEQSQKRSSVNLANDEEFDDDFGDITQGTDPVSENVEMTSGYTCFPFKNMPLDELVEYICQTVGCNYKVKGNKIIISKAVPPVDLSKYIIKRPSELLDLERKFIEEVLVHLEKSMDTDYPSHNIEFIFDSELHNKRMKSTTKEELSSFTYEESEELEDDFDDEFESEFGEDFEDDEFEAEFEDDFDEDFETDEFEDVAPIEVTSGTLGSFRNMPLDDTIAYICQTVGCRYIIKGNKVIIY